MSLGQHRRGREPHGANGARSVPTGGAVGTGRLHARWRPRPELHVTAVHLMKEPALRPDQGFRDIIAAWNR